MALEQRLLAAALELRSADARLPELGGLELALLEVFDLIAKAAHVVCGEAALL